MATAEEILAGMAEETVEETLEIVIDESLQKMIIPPGLTHLGVAGDDSVKTLYFRCPKMHGKYDLSEFEIFVSYTNEGAAGRILPVSNKVINDSDMTFECELEGDAFLYKGFTAFALNMRLYDENYIPIKKFNTEPEKLPVKEGMDNGENFFERYPDIIQQLLDEIADLKENGVGTGGTARSIQFQVVNYVIQYRYEGDTEWITLFDMNTLPSVQYTVEQELTDAQKARARMNMGAVGIAHDEWQDGNIPIFDAYSTYLEGDAMVRDSGIPINKIEEATNAVPTHNTSSESHNDIRLLIQNVQKALEAFLDIDDESMNQATEFVAYMKDNRELIEQVTTNKVSVSDIVDDYVTNVSNKPVSAAVAVKLKALIDAIVVPTKTSQLTNDSRFVTEDITNQLSQEKVDKTGLTLGAGTDGLIYIFVDGVQTGAGVALGEIADVYGYIDSNNNIILEGLPNENGTYTASYKMTDGTLVSIGNLVFMVSVTNNLTNCANSNDVTEVGKGKSYSATITANSGYELSSIVVTMGGTDITSIAVSGGNISIAEVNGDIVITAVAEESTPTYTNLATSFQEGYRHNSSGTTTAFDGATACLDYIPFTKGTVVRVKGFGDLTFTNSAVYSSSKSVLNSGKVTIMSSALTYSYDSTTGIVTLTCIHDQTAFIRVAGKLTGTTNDVIITVNEEIA